MKRAFAVLILTASGTVGAALPGGSADELLIVPSSIDLLAPCRSECKPCTSGMGHKLVEDTVDGPLSAEPHDCDPDDPCDDKSVCDPHAPAPSPEQVASAGGDDSDAVRVAVLERRYDDLAQLVRARPDKITINEKRSAVQLLDCAGKVVAHYPIPQAAVAAIALMAD
ncbi:MAG: hypothetical protein ACREMQ_17960 [Longimicrobiales bacterium]